MSLERKRLRLLTRYGRGKKEEGRMIKCYKSYLAGRVRDWAEGGG